MNNSRGKKVRFDLSKNQEKYVDFYDRKGMKKTPLIQQMKEVDFNSEFSEAIRLKINKLGTLTFSELIKNFEEEYKSNEVETLASIKLFTKMKKVDGKIVFKPLNI